ncbi:hypothetical protein LTR17_015250 [Elasticomyces elasticus]|nr:hypothetical protein LTR17_015250 [Elasticomyces elasticus]
MVLIITVAVSLTLAGGAIAQGLNGSLFPDVTWPDAVSPNPAAVAGAQSNQKSPPKYPSPWADGSGGWSAAYDKAVALVKKLTLEEKGVNVAASFDKKLAYLRGQTMGEEFQAKGASCALG